MPRGQYILNRQIVEYFARNRWFLENKSAAVMDMDLLPKTVYLEVQQNQGAFKRPALRSSNRGQLFGMGSPKSGAR